MSRVVTADANVILNVNDTSTAGTAAAKGIVISVTENNLINYTATAPNTAVTQEWTGLLTLVASTPQTLDLTTLTGPFGATVAFANVVYLYAYNTGTHPVAVGNAASNPFAPGWSATTHVETLNANSRWFKENNGTAWTVDSTHKALMFDPGGTATTVKVIIVGN